MSGPPSRPPVPFLSKAGSKPGQLGLKGTAGLQLKKPAGAPISLAPPAGKLGLQLSKPKKPAASASVFASALDDDLDDDASERARMNAELKRSHEKSAAASRAAMQAAELAASEQDASVYDYDGVYDSMQQERSALRQSVRPKEDTSAKYIGSIMAAHKVREMENEKLFERKLVKEAEAEAQLYGDKERFMTCLLYTSPSPRDS